MIRSPDNQKNDFLNESATATSAKEKVKNTSPRKKRKKLVSMTIDQEVYDELKKIVDADEFGKTVSGLVGYCIKHCLKNKLL